MVLCSVIQLQWRVNYNEFGPGFQLFLHAFFGSDITSALSWYGKNKLCSAIQIHTVHFYLITTAKVFLQPTSTHHASHHTISSLSSCSDWVHVDECREGLPSKSLSSWTLTSEQHWWPWKVTGTAAPEVSRVINFFQNKKHSSQPIQTYWEVWGQYTLQLILLTEKRCSGHSQCHSQHSRLPASSWFRGFRRRSISKKSVVVYWCRRETYPGPISW